MAAARGPVASDPDIVDLRELRGRDLAPLLAEQTATWKSRFCWDFRSTADIILRFLDSRTLQGYALRAGERPVGYSYFIQEETKALIGDLYIAGGFRSGTAERRLLDQTLHAAVQHAGVRRIEGQLLALSFRLQPNLLYGLPLHVYERLLMIHHDLRLLPPLSPRAERLDYRPWSDRVTLSVADLIARSYVGHVDSQINDQYRSPASARRFLANTTHHPGCGSFLPRASFIARRPGSDETVGACLATRIDESVGHVTQLCVAPEWRGRGVGGQLLRRTMTALRHSGCNAVSLTVTASNEPAVELYRSVGFVVWRDFPALVWDGR